MINSVQGLQHVLAFYSMLDCFLSTHLAGGMSLYLTILYYYYVTE